MCCGVRDVVPAQPISEDWSLAVPSDEHYRDTYMDLPAA